MFYGTEERILDERGRISLPRKIVDKLGERPFVLKCGSYLLLYQEGRRETFKSSRVEEVKIDAHGRLCLPAKLLSSFSSRSLLIKGEGNHLVIRSRRRLSYEELTVQEAEDLYLRGIPVVPNADRKEVKIG